ncbi:two-component system response regulator LytT [Clostridium algifaecis]|uniref:Stage 0 sporulation protein A homolog n=1 Tax=Clostridium algifaecis TaxID=1472040 RepID=A0ABS4KUN8_9CLOT|nr:LytTR family DNA-binding domain-containing protein [Clostridium algifaecis]MBP2033176.1 two-component system response regulator LytT [Clostridium algifaecis]
MDNKLNCVIVEDEIPAAKELEYIISKYDNILVNGIATNGKSGLEIIKDKRPDAVFMDINMPLKNGIELAKEVKEFDNSIDVIFVTAYEEHAVEAFRLYALDYVLKPFDENRIDITINRLIDKWKEKNEKKEKLPDLLNQIVDNIHNTEKIVKRIACEKNGKIVLINTKDIYFCYIKNEKTYVKTKDESYLVGYTLGQIEEKTKFFRTHRSYLVNMDNIKELYSWFNGTYKLVMNDKNNTEVPISRSNVKKLKKYLEI